MSIYYHKHHIIPKHMGGTDDPSNLVLVTVEQHANLHKQLWEDLGHWQDKIAWKFLSGQINIQDAIRESRSEALKLTRGKKKKPATEERKRKISEAKKGKSINYPKNRKSRSAEDKLRVSEKMRGEKNHFFGKKHSEETKEKIRKSLYRTN
jgi:hypothetical protein